MYGRISLGQKPLKLRVVVNDRCGDPVPGISVVAVSQDWVGSSTTDEDGAVIMEVPEESRDVIVTANLPEGKIRQKITLSPLEMHTVVFRSVRRIEGPFITLVEGVAVLSGIACIVLGSHLGKTLGSILTGIGGSVTAAAVYSSVSRKF